MNELNALQNLVRIGWVSSVNKNERTARVRFDDKGETIVSAPLKVLITTSVWLPDIGDFVVCLYLPKGGSDGFVIGRT